MTVEEIEIIVTAKVEEALKEFKKMLPQIKQEMAKVQKEVEKVDFNGLAKQVKASGIDKELGKVKQKIKEAFNTDDVKFNTEGLEDEKKELKNVSEEYQKLKQKANELGSAINKEDFGTEKYYELRNALAKVNHELNIAKGKDMSMSGYKYDSNSIQDKIDRKSNIDNPEKVSFTISNTDSTVKYESEQIRELKRQAEELGEAFRKEDFGTSKFYELRTALGKVNHELNVARGKVEDYDYEGMLNKNIANKNNTNQNVTTNNVSTNIQPSQQSLSLWDTLKAKIQQIKPQVQQAQNMIRNMSINPNTKQLDLVKYKISEIEEKLQNVKEGKIHLNTSECIKAEAELERLNNQKNKLEGNSRGNMFSTIFSSLKKITPQMNNISGITVKIRNNIKTWGTGIKTGIGQVIRYAGTLLSLQSIYSALSGSANSWLSSQNTQAQQLSANIEYMKYALGSALAPAIQTVVNLIYQALKGVQSLVYALTGVNIFANASAKAYSSMASSANKAAKSSKEASNSIADFDEIHNIQKDNGKNSGNGGGTTAPNMDLSGLDTQLSPWQQKLYNFFKPLIDSWNTYGPNLVAQIQTTAGQVVYLISSVWGSFEKIITNGTVYSILENILAIIGNIAEAFANAWNNDGNGDAIIQALANALNNLLDAINKIVQSELFQGILDIAIEAFRKLAEGVEFVTGKLNEFISYFTGESKEKLDGWAIAIGAIAVAIGIVATAWGIYTVAQTIANVVMNACPIILIITLIAALVAAIIGIAQNWDEISKWLSESWEWLKQKATEIFTAIGDFFKNIWNSIKDFFVNIWNSIKDFFVNLCVSIFTKSQEIWNNIKNAISNVINGIKTTISNVLNTIKSIWSNIWNGLKTTVTNIFNGIWNAIKKVINSILGGIEGMANGVVSGVNLVIRTLNKLKFTVPDWVPGMGGKTFGFNLSEISKVSLPRLAKGGVLYEDTIIQAGEYSNARTNPEIVTPQNIMYDTMIKALKENSNTGNNETINFENKLVVNGKVFAREIIEDLDAEARRRGYKPILQH